MPTGVLYAKRSSIMLYLSFQSACCSKASQLSREESAQEGLQGKALDVIKYYEGNISHLAPPTNLCGNEIFDNLSGFATVSLRLGHATALTLHRSVIHYRVDASLPYTGEAWLAIHFDINFHFINAFIKE